MKPKLVTVTSGRTNILRHHVNHYKDSVSDICVILYKNDNSPKNIIEEVEDLLKEFGLKLFQIKNHRPNDWVELSRFYNLTKYLHCQSHSYFCFVFLFHILTFYFFAQK